MRLFSPHFEPASNPELALQELILLLAPWARYPARMVQPCFLGESVMPDSEKQMVLDVRYGEISPLSSIMLALV
jgi:hypothetical protein